MQLYRMNDLKDFVAGGEMRDVCALLLVQLAWPLLFSTPSLPCPFYLPHHFFHALSLSSLLLLPRSPATKPSSFPVCLLVFRRGELGEVQAQYTCNAALSWASPSRVLLTLHKVGKVPNVFLITVHIERSCLLKRSKLSGAYWKDIQSDPSTISMEQLLTLVNLNFEVLSILVKLLQLNTEWN